MPIATPKPTYVDFITFDWGNGEARPIDKTATRGAIITDGAAGEYKSFICYGCQTCWRFGDENMEGLVEYYPHFIAPFERVLAGP